MSLEDADQSDLNVLDRNRQVDQKFLGNVLKVVAKKKATYPTEVSKYVDQDIDKCAKLLRQLEESGVLERLKPKMKNYDGRIVSRRNDGIFSGIEEAKRMSWYGLNSVYDWQLKVNNRELYVNEYHEVIDQPEEISENLVDMAVNKMG